jgi:hypothetical protein
MLGDQFKAGRWRAIELSTAPPTSDRTTAVRGSLSTHSQPAVRAHPRHSLLRFGAAVTKLTVAPVNDTTHLPTSVKPALLQRPSPWTVTCRSLHLARRRRGAHAGRPHVALLCGTNWLTPSERWPTTSSKTPTSTSTPRATWTRSRPRPTQCLAPIPPARRPNRMGGRNTAILAADYSARKRVAARGHGRTRGCSVSAGRQVAADRGSTHASQRTGTRARPADPVGD